MIKNRPISLLNNYNIDNTSKNQYGGTSKFLENILKFLKDYWYIIILVIFGIILLLMRLSDMKNKKIESLQFVEYMKNREVYLENLKEFNKKYNDNNLENFDTNMNIEIDNSLENNNYNIEYNDNDDNDDINLINENLNTGFSFY